MVYNKELLLYKELCNYPRKKKKEREHGCNWNKDICYIKRYKVIYSSCLEQNGICHAH